MVSWSKFLEKVVSDFKDKGHTFNDLAEMTIITLANKMDISYDFYMRHNMHAVEWKLNSLINKNKRLLNKFNCDWKHPLNGKFEIYRV